MKTKITSLFIFCFTLLPLFSWSQVEVIENGNVGIGVSSPTEKLDVNGNVTMSGSATITDPDGGYHQIKDNALGGTYGVVINYPGKVLKTSSGQQGAIVVAFKDLSFYWVNMTLLLYDYHNYDHVEITVSGIRYPSGSFKIIGREIISEGDWNAAVHTDMIRFGRNNANEGVMIIGDFNDTHGGGAGPAIYSIKSIQTTYSLFKSDGVEIFLDNNAANYIIDETYTDRLNEAKISDIVMGAGNSNSDFVKLSNRNFEEFGRFHYNILPSVFGDGDDFTISASNHRDLVLQTYNANIILNNNGNVGISTVAPNEKLHVIGNIKASGSVMASCGTLSCSDVRYKKNFQPLQNVQEKLGRINAVYYNWRQSEFPDMHFDDKTYLGFKAQEVEQQFPELVHTDENGYKSVDYARMSVVLLEAVKELQNENKALKQAFTQLDSKVDQLIELEDRLLKSSADNDEALSRPRE